MLKSGSDNKIKDFLRLSSFGRIGILLIIGAVLILLSFAFGSEAKVKASEEEKTARLCSMVDGAGECIVAITYREQSGEDRVFAVAVLCEGAESVSVRRDITDLICSLYGIGANRVSIISLEV